MHADFLSLHTCRSYDLKVFSVSLELPEFKVVKQVFHEEFFQLNVVKKSTEERFPYCGFLTNHVHDRRTRKVRDLKVLDRSEEHTSELPSREKQRCRPLR